ncbi:MAG: segregation/condensation protein A [Terracidiphilus sp.]
MVEKTIPWWRKALNYALGRIRSGFGLFPKPAQSAPQEEHSFFNRREESREVETALTEQPTHPETIPAVAKIVAEHVPVAEAAPVASIAPLAEPPIAAPVESAPTQEIAPSPESAPEPDPQPEHETAPVALVASVVEPAPDAELTSAVELLAAAEPAPEAAEKELDLSQGIERASAGTEALDDFAALAARLKSCPDTKPPRFPAEMSFPAVCLASAPYAEPVSESALAAEPVPEPASPHSGVIGTVSDPPAEESAEPEAATDAEPGPIVEPTAATQPIPEPLPAPVSEPLAVPVTEPAPAPETGPPPAPTPKPFIKLESRDNEADLSPFSVIVAQVYDGPLDLLLDLIRKQDIDIYDIPIAKITAQFLAYVGQLRASDVDVAGEFIYTASLLIHIKSKMLLPRAPVGPGEVPEDPRRELVERLLEHERFKNAAQMLQQKQMIEAATWTNPGFREFQDDASVEPEIAADTVDLVRVFRDILERVRSRPVFDLNEDAVTVGQMIQFLARRLTMEDKPVALRRLLSHTRSERALIAMFLALLELVRMQAVLLRQDRQFSEIFIKKHTGFEAAMNEGLANARDDWK